jgi:hypothetical protein
MTIGDTSQRNILQTASIPIATHVPHRCVIQPRDRPGSPVNPPPHPTKENILAFSGSSTYIQPEQTPNINAEASMSLATFPAAVLETILTRLAALFLIGAAGDMEAARQAALQMLGAYHPETEDELSLAAHIISFSFQALEALGQAAAPDLPLTRILRLRGGAVSLSRESAKAQRRLTQCQQDRRKATPAESVQPSAKIEKAVELMQESGQVAAAAKANGLTWTQAYEQRQRDVRIAASIKRAEARVAMQANTPTPSQQNPTMAQAV